MMGSSNMSSGNYNISLSLTEDPTISENPMCQSAWFNLHSNMSTSTSDVDTLARQLVSRNIYGMVFVAIQMIVGILGNSVVLFVYGRKYKRSNYRVYVLFLAFLDIGSCVLTMPFVIVFLYFAVNFPSDFICRAGLLVGYTFGIAQSEALVLIAFDRYRKICHPLKKQISVKYAKISCIAIVLFALGCTWFTPFLYGAVTESYAMGHSNVTKCYLADDKIARVMAKAYYILLMVLFVIVTTLLCVLYFFIMKKVYSHSKAFYSVTKASPTAMSTRSRSLRTRKTTLTFVIITAVYILCTIPHDVLGLVFHIVEDLDCRLSYSAGSAFFLFYWTVFLNNIANPIIYGLSDDRFCTILKGYILRARGQKSPDPATTENSKNISSASNFNNPVARSISSNSVVCKTPDPTQSLN